MSETRINKVLAFNPPLKWVREQIENAGNKIGSVYFYKRSDNSLRKMSYRLHVRPKSVNEIEDIRPSGLGRSLKKWRKMIDEANNQMTVYDTNKVLRDSDGKIIGRGAYRTIPLENVTRIKNNGIEYEICKY